MNIESRSLKSRFFRKAASLFLSTTLLASTFTGLGSVLMQKSSLDVSAASDYGLADNIQDGNILHCFCWKYDDIIAMLPEIAEAGFTSIQTSPPQATAGTGAWWWFYQPLGFYIGSNAMGNKESLTRLCSEADKYGIKIIADVVANHLAGDHSNIQDDLKGSDYWHKEDYNADDGDRYRVTHGKIGMPDLNTENSHVQECVVNYLQELKSVGVDGIRFDAAKHIGLPSEGDQFWPTVTADKSLWYYGEILNNPGVSFDSQRQTAINVMREYSNYIGITDSVYGQTLRNSFHEGRVPSDFGCYVGEWMGLPESRLVYWGESHDTWSNNEDWGYSNHMSQNTIDRAYAIAGSRNGITALYFSRPSSKVKDNIKIGEKGSTHFTSKEVAAVNHFKNALIGEKDYYTTGDNCAVVCRASGAVVVLGSGSDRDVTVPNGGGTTKPGTYTDEITGSTWTVTSSTISGHIGSTGIAVVYNPSSRPVPGSVSVSPTSGSFVNTMSVTLTANNVSNASYTTSEGDSGTFTGTKTITVGAKTSEGSSVTVTVSGTKEDGTNVTATGSFKKKSESDLVTVNVDNSVGNWSNVYAYVYTGEGESAKSMAAWPGVKMTQSGKYYTLDVSGYEQGKVIFNDGTGSATNRYPEDMKPGLSIGGSSKLFTMPNKWEELPDTPVKKLSVSLSASPSTVKVGQAVTITATPSNASGTVSYSYKAGSETISGSGSSVTWTPSSAGSVTITVTASDSSGSATANTTVTVQNGSDTSTPTVTSNKASGTSFTTETFDITLSLSNAVSGTYSVDGGPTKKFTGSQTVTIGEGKIGDSTVNVTATATGSNGTTKTYNFSYEKKYVVKTSSSSAPSANTKYVTNPDGALGAKKTITSAKDFTPDTMIARGVANDDPAAFRGTHEAPKFDQYALYAAWDDTNLYVGIQYVNVIDVVDPAQESPQTGRGKPNGADADIPQMILLDVKSGDYTDGSTNNPTQPTVWNTNITFGANTKVDRVIMYSPKEGIDNWGVFPVHNGIIDYESDQTYTPKYQVPLPGASIAWEDGFFLSTMDGINANGYGGYKPADLESTSGKWVDFLTTNHSTKHDTFCIMTMPLKYLGITANDISSNGIGLMAVATYGSSGIGCLPHDTVMLDNATEPYEQDDSTSGEKSDADQINVPLASVGKSGGDIIIPPKPDTPLQVNFGADKSAPQLPTASLKLKGIGIGGKAPYTYAFYVDDTKVQSASSTDSYSWTPGTAGNHTIKCIITDSTNASATSTKTYTVEKAGDDPIPPTALSNNSTVSATSIKTGSSVTLKGTASGGTPSYQYAFYYKLSSASSYTTIKGFSSTASASFSPSAAGKYTLKVTVKDSGGNSKDKTFTVTVTKSETTTALTNKSTISASTLKLGSSLTVNCAASGGTTPYKYAVFYKKSSSTSYTTVQDYSTNKTVSIKPTTPTVYNIRVKVKDAKGTVKTLDFDIAVTNPEDNTLKNTSKLSASSITKGKSVTITGSASGGKTPYKYSAFYKKSTDSSFTKIRDYSTTATMTFKPASTGTYTIRIKVKDASGKIVSKDASLKVTAASLTNVSTVSAASVALGKSITITGKATGGTTPYQYAAYYKKASSSDYTTLRNYSTTATMTFKPAAATSYNLRVKVKDKTGKVVTKDFTITATAALANKSTVSATSVALGKSITITGKATGGTSPYQYAAYYKKSSASDYTTLKNYSSTATMTFKPAAAATYNLKVRVKDKTGKVVAKEFTIKATAALANKSTVSATSVALGKSITITGKATGGTSPYQYAAYYKKSSASDYTTLKNYSTTATMTFKPAAAATYNLKVRVKDKTGKVVAKEFTIKATAASTALTNTSKLSASTITLGTSATVKCSATGGKTGYKYAVSYKKATSSDYTSLTGGYTTTASATFKPAAATNYLVLVKVKDAAGTVKSVELKLTVKK